MKRGRTLLVAAIIVSLLVTAAVQKLAVNERAKLLRTPAGGSGGPSIASMDSYALALLLGGLRGPLVMFLWMQSEASKQEKDLEGVETQIEWIRLLQPEFDTVHLFQIWNKAYNISVQMASLANKYSVILDALDYAKSVDRQRPDSLNIIMSVGSIFNDKFASSSEKAYYRKRVREDSMYRPAETVARTVGVRPTRYQSLLEQDGMIRPELLAPRVSLGGAKPTTSPADRENYDGSELQYLKKYQPFPYGVPAFGLAYNYFERAKTLQNETGQRHIQISPMVVDSRPALTLRAWADEEWDLGARAEDRLMGLPVPADRYEALMDTGNLDPLKLTPEQIQSRKADLKEALYRYDLAVQLAEDAETSFREHFAKPQYQMHVEMYRSHVEHLLGVKQLLSADADVLKALSATGEERKALIKSAVDNYKAAVRQFEIIRLRYYTPEFYYPNLFAKGTTRWNLEQCTNEQIAGYLAAVAALDKKNPQYMEFQDDNREYESYAKRAQERIRVLTPML